MSERKCIELTAVYADGTIAKWEGKDAERADNVLAAELGSEPCYVVPTTTTHPLRRVTTLLGHFGERGSWGKNGTGIYAEPDWQSIQFDESLVPESSGCSIGTDDGGSYPGNGPDCEWRITVEAMPVEGGKP